MADSYSLKAILSAVDGISPVLKSVQGAAKNARKYLGDVGGSINSLASKIGVPTALISGLAAGLGALAIKKYVTDFAAYSEGVIKSGLVMGSTTAEAQRMAYVFEQAGAPIEAAQKSMGKLNQNLASAASGKNKDLEQLLKQLQIPLRGVNGQVRSATDLLPQLADAFVKNKNPAAQAAMGVALYGKSYQEILPFLNEGSEGILASLERFKQLGDVIGDQDLKGAKAFGDQLQDLGFIAQNFQRMIARELVPILGPLIERLIQWIAANKGLISGQISGFVKSLVAAIESVDWTAFIDGVRGVVAWVGSMIDRIGGVKNALILLLVIMNVQTIAAIGGIVSALGRLTLALGAVIVRMAVMAGGAAMGVIKGMQGIALAMRIMGLSAAASWAIAMGPLLLVAAVLAGVAYAIYANWGGILAFFGGVWSGIIDALGPVAAAFQPVTDAISAVFRWVVSLFGATDESAEKLASWANAGRVAGEVIGTVFKAILTPIVAVFDAISLVVAAFKFLGGGGFKFESSLAQLAGGGQSSGGGLASGPRNLNAPAVASLTGKVDINFQNAPPGMTVTQARADGPRVALNPNVGYRSLGATGAF